MKKGKSCIGAIADFISSRKGQRFFNFAYSIGAAIVILGALFKILHLPFGNLLLSVGMGTEVAMFVLTAFDYSYPENAESNRADASQTANSEPNKKLIAETERMTEAMRRLNEVYEGMLNAMQGKNHFNKE